MAKKDGKGRIRVFFAKIEGDDDTIQDGLKALTGAVSKTFQPKVVVVPRITGEEPESPMPAEIDELVEEASNGDDVLEATAKKKGSGGKSKPPKFTLVSDLDLRPKDGTAFREFYVEKAPKTQNEQVAVIVYYLKKIVDVPAVTSDHVYTCLKDASAKVPTFLPNVIRNCASQKGWVDSSNSKDLNITTSGENFVEHELPAG